jgi:hypothetical protein
MGLILIWLAASAIISAQTSPPADEQRAVASEQIERLEPFAFPQLPKTVVLDLEKRACLIPQIADVAPHNVLRGEFIRVRQIDWAVLCSQKKKTQSIRATLPEAYRLLPELWISSILVYHDGSPTNVDELQPVPDIAMMGDKVFLRSLSAVGKEYIEEHYLAYAGEDTPKLPVLDHEGINDSFLEKASIVNYFADGKWIKLPGAD